MQKIKEFICSHFGHKYKILAVEDNGTLYLCTRCNKTLFVKNKH